MAFELNPYGVKITAVAGADLSTHQYKFVRFDVSAAPVGGAGTYPVVLCDAATDIPIGVLQNTPIAGQEAEITVAGVTKVVAGAAITGANINADGMGTDATGRAVVKTKGTVGNGFVAGRTIQPASAAGEVVAATIDCSAPTRCA